MKETLREWLLVTFSEWEMLSKGLGLSLSYGFLPRRKDTAKREEALRCLEGMVKKGMAEPREQGFLVDPKYKRLLVEASQASGIFHAYEREGSQYCIYKGREFLLTSPVAARPDTLRWSFFQEEEVFPYLEEAGFFQGREEAWGELSGEEDFLKLLELSQEGLRRQADFGWAIDAYEKGGKSRKGRLVQMEGLIPFLVYDMKGARGCCTYTKERAQGLFRRLLKGETHDIDGHLHPIAGGTDGFSIG